MGRMSDLHIEMCEKVEKIMCDRLCMTPCEHTYELAADIVEAVGEELAKGASSDE